MFLFGLGVIVGVVVILLLLWWAGQNVGPNF